uniref:Ig-like domain-containing protein n=1 Tax=Steinernema glaseri TaxID=37863 RepID=A0A1I7XY68_9BILA
MTKSVLFLTTLCALLLSVAVEGSDVDSCQTTCFLDKEPRCEARLEQSNVVESSGIYQIDESLVELKCNFSSHNNNVKVSWLYRPKYAESWEHVRCTQTEQRNNCDLDREPSFSSLSLCRLRVTGLVQEGFYKCRGEMSDGVSRRVERFESDEGDIRVVGIESIHTKPLIILNHGLPAMMELRVCANPQPEIFWLSGDDALKSGESRGRFAVSAVHHWYQPRLNGTSEPKRLHSYCYVSRLLVSAAQLADEKIRAVVRSDGDTRTVAFDVRVIGAQIRNAASAFFGMLTTLAVVLVHLFSTTV